MDVVESLGRIASKVAGAGDGKTIGLGDSMDIELEILSIETRDFEAKKAALLKQNLQIQQPLFAR